MHKDSSLLLEYKLEVANNGIRYKFSIGRDELSSTYASLFHGNFKELISKDISSELQWLD